MGQKRITKERPLSTIEQHFYISIGTGFELSYPDLVLLSLSYQASRT